MFLIECFHVAMRAIDFQLEGDATRDAELFLRRAEQRRPEPVVPMRLQDVELFEKRNGGCVLHAVKKSNVRETDNRVVFRRDEKAAEERRVKCPRDRNTDLFAGKRQGMFSHLAAQKIYELGSICRGCETDRCIHAGFERCLELQIALSIGLLRTASSVLLP